MIKLLPSTLILLATTTLAAGGPDRQMAITFDDLPAQRIQQLPPARIAEITDGIVGVLAEQKLPAVGFVNEDKLEVDGKVDPARVRLLERWLDAGLELGNHTYSHPSLHHTPRAEFEQDVLRGARITPALAEARNRPWRWFRHPYLHTGRDLETKLAIETFLQEHGYRIAPVTVDNSEWIFARAYDEALDRNDPALQQRLATAYLDYMEEMVAYYEVASQRLFEREIPQVLLVHANALNAHHFGALVERLRQRGYRFINLETALQDPAYQSPDTFTGAGGITWLHRWALTRGVEKSFFDGEPRTPQWVQEVAGIEE